MKSLKTKLILIMIGLIVFSNTIITIVALRQSRISLQVTIAEDIVTIGEAWVSVIDNHIQSTLALIDSVTKRNIRTTGTSTQATSSSQTSTTSQTTTRTSSTNTTQSPSSSMPASVANRLNALQDPAATVEAKIAALERYFTRLKDYGAVSVKFVGSDGQAFHLDGSTSDEKDWIHFKDVMNGEFVVDNPEFVIKDSKFIQNYSVPLRTSDKVIYGALVCSMDGADLSKFVGSFKFREKGESMIVDKSGTVIASKNIDRVKSKYNIVDTEVITEGEHSLKELLKSGATDSTHYEYEDVENHIAVVPIPQTRWVMLLHIPEVEIDAPIIILQKKIFFVGVILLLSASFIAFWLALTIVTPIKRTAAALKNIAQGDGDLKVRLAITTKDEIGQMSSYFNQTMEKISLAIGTVGQNTTKMQVVGEELASNMSETASAVNQITVNIGGVKDMVMNQALSVTGTQKTIEQIVKNIEKLGNSIETQATNVIESSSAVEEMVSNIRSVTSILEKNVQSVAKLEAEANGGLNTVQSVASTTQKINSDSEGLMEASSVIQHIASQTNLLAMNAAIEAAHAGSAGKGFAVVADEIRKLAEESSSQGKAISAVLKALKEEIEAVSQSAANVQKQFNTIVALTNVVKEQETVVMNAMREQTSGSEQVLTAIEEINIITSDVKLSSHAMMESTREALVEMKNIAQVSDEINSSMTEMAAGTKQINEAVHEANKITQTNKDGLEQLAGEVSKFKI